MAEQVNAVIASSHDHIKITTKLWPIIENHLKGRQTEVP